MALKILIADDNITAQNLGKKILTEAGYEVVAVSNGAAAMKKIASEKPALLVLDVYMPGYSGLEVCEKVKKAPETAQVPVLLTMGQMEAFDPAEGTRVKADGVISKPFVASDLLAVVQKLEEKLHPAAEAAPTEAARTMKMEAAPEPEIQDASYEAWKAEAPEASEAEAEVEEKVSVPEGMGEAPAFGMEEMMEEAPPSAPPAVGMEETVAEAPPASPTAQGIPFLEMEREAAAEAATAEIPATPAPGVEFTSAPQGGEARIETAPELMVEDQHAGEIAITRDAALVTDPSEMAKEFVTKFGVENPEDIPVGVATPEVSEEEAAIAAIAEVPGEEAEPAHEAEVAAAPEAPAEAAAPAEEEQTESAAASLEEEMQRAMEAAPEPAPAPEPEPEAAAPPPEPEPFEPEPEPVMAAPPAPPPLAVEAGGDVTQKLVAEFEAELQPAAEAPAEEAVEAAPAEAPAAAPTVDEDRLAQAISRAMERLKPELIAEIARELKKS